MKLTQTIKWNKLTVRKPNEEDRELYGDRYDSIWEGKIPEIDEEVLIYDPNKDNYYTDTMIFTDVWVDYTHGIGFEQTDVEIGETIYWSSFPEPPKLD